MKIVLILMFLCQYLGFMSIFRLLLKMFIMFMKSIKKSTRIKKLQKNQLS